MKLAWKVLAIHTLERINRPYAVRLALRLFARPQHIPRPPHEDELIKKGERLVLKCGLVAYKFGKGPAVLLVHGWEGRGTQLGFFVAPLVDKGYSVYALDGPCHGESPGVETSPTHYATFIKTVSTEVGPLKAVIAHSFGAGSTILAADNGMKVEKIVLIAGPDLYSRVLDYYCAQIRLSPKSKEMFFQIVTNRVGMAPDQLQVSRIGKNLKQKILVVHDRHDKSVSFESAERIHQEISGSELLVTEGLGHRRIMKDPQVIVKVVDFIG